MVERASSSIKTIRIVVITMTSRATNPGYEKKPSKTRKYMQAIIISGYGRKMKAMEILLNTFQFWTV